MTEFYASSMHIANDTHSIRTDKPIPPALCLGTPVPGQ